MQVNKFCIYSILLLALAAFVMYACVNRLMDDRYFKQEVGNENILTHVHNGTRWLFVEVLKEATRFEYHNGVFIAMNDSGRPLLREDFVGEWQIHGIAKNLSEEKWIETITSLGGSPDKNYVVLKSKEK